MGAEQRLPTPWEKFRSPTYEETAWIADSAELKNKSWRSRVEGHPHQVAYESLVGHRIPIFESSVLPQVTLVVHGTEVPPWTKAGLNWGGHFPSNFLDFVSAVYHGTLQVTDQRRTGWAVPMLGWTFTCLVDTNVLTPPPHSICDLGHSTRYRLRPSSSVTSTSRWPWSQVSSSKIAPS